MQPTIPQEGEYDSEQRHASQSAGHTLQGRKVSTQHPDSSDQSTTMGFRVVALEQRVNDIQKQFMEYERSREIDLKLQNFRDQVLQIRQEILDARKELAEIGTKQIAQELATQNQAAAERAERDKLQIRVLIAIVSFVATILGGIILYIVTHLHP